MRWSSFAVSCCTCCPADIIRHLFIGLDGPVEMDAPSDLLEAAAEREEY
jgi:hypothetical protein